MNEPFLSGAPVDELPSAEVREPSPSLEVVEVLDSTSSDTRIGCEYPGCHATSTSSLRVRLSDGSELRIGRQCGARHFKSSLGPKLQAFDKLRAAQDDAQTWQAFRDRHAALLERVAALRRAPIGTDWCVDARKALLSSVGPDLANELRERARRADPMIVSLDADRDISAPGKADVLSGLSFINSYPELRLEAVRNKLFESVGVDFAALPVRKQREWLRWVGEIDAELAAVEHGLSEAVAFLAPPNLQLLPLLMPTAEGRAQARRSSGGWKLPKVPAAF